MSLETYLWAHWRLFHEYYCALAYRSLHVPYGDANSYDRMLAAGSETACRNLPELLWYTSDAVALAAVERGVYAYDPEEAARCIEATRAVGDPLTWYNRRIASARGSLRRCWARANPARRTRSVVGRSTVMDRAMRCVPGAARSSAAVTTSVSAARIAMRPDALRQALRRGVRSRPVGL